MTHDLLVIGSGPGGYETAATAAEMGLKVALFERDQLGGTCLNRGCIPTKTLCRSAKMALDVRESAAFGILFPAGTPEVDYPRIAQRKDEVVAALREGVAMVLRDVEVIRAEARFVSQSEIEAGGSVYSAPRIIIATGSAPAVPPIQGASLAMTSDDLLAATSLPRSIVIIGAGVIGLEFASILNALGVEVTVMEFCKEILPPFDADIAKRLRMSLKRRGITFLTDAKVTSIEPGFNVTASVKGKDRTVSAESVLMAVGRRPVPPPGIEELGACVSRGAIQVGDDMEVLWHDGCAPAGSHVYAIGDVNARCMLAHAATAQGRRALGLDVDLDVIPSAVFTEPECAMVGLTETQCLAGNLDIRIGTSTFRANGKALAMGETDGMVKIIAESSTGRILGCHICGAHAADLIQEVATAMTAGLPVTAISTAIHSHPSLTEALPAAVHAMR